MKRFSNAMLVSWNELSATQRRGFPIYIVRYQSTNTGDVFETSPTSKNYALIENLSPNNAYMVSVFAAVREEQEILAGPISESVEALAFSSTSKLIEY